MNELKKRSIGIDILKAISLISVIIYHFYEYKGTYIGVILFFVISGYLITEVLYEREDSYFSFIQRRYNKIFPPLIAVLTFTYLAFYYFYDYISEKLIYSSFSSLLGVSNLYQICTGMSYFERSGDLFPLLHTWSLSIEIQFYILFPFLIYLFKKFKLDKKIIIAIIMSLALISAGLMFYKEYMNYDISAIYYGTDTRIFSVFMGSAFYFLFKDKDLENEKQKLNIISYVCLGIIIVITLSVDYLSKSNYYGFLFLISILGSFMTVTSLKTGFLDFDNPVAKPLAKLGEHSYVYYLWQYPLMIFSLEFFKWSDIDYNYTVGIQVIILIILSEISYEFLIKRRQESIVLRRIFLVLYVALLSFLPISSETNSEEVKNRANEIDKMAVVETPTTEKVETTENTSKVEDKNQVEEKTLATKVSTAGHKEIKTDNNPSKTSIKTVVKTTDSIEAKDYTFIGDSVMKMGEPYIKEIFKDANVDAKVSRQFTDLPKILEELKGNRKLKNTVVIHLGTNGVINKEAFETSMKLLKGKKVYIMNTVVPKPWEKSVNKSLAEWSLEYDNITMIDWHKYAKGEKQLFYKDATHPKPEGAKKYAEFIFKNIKR